MGMKYEKMRHKKITICDMLEEQVKKSPHKTLLVFQGNNYTYEFISKQANKISRVAVKLGLQKGDVVAVLMHNGPQFLWTWLGLTKLGIEVAFLNYNLRSKSLYHCFKTSGARTLIVGDEDLLEAVNDISQDLAIDDVKIYVHGIMNAVNGYLSFDDLVNGVSDAPFNEKVPVSYSDTACLIYTSGTTGLPKAAVVTVAKVTKGSLITDGVNLDRNDIVYTPLPLYHSAASLIAFGGTVRAGCTLVLRSKFSASQFWNDCIEHNVTVIQYIGELCRYLVARPKCPEEKQHQVRAAVGNGLRADIWKEFQERFHIKDICEFYAATEANVGLINVLNKPYSIGRLSPLLSLLYPAQLVKYDLSQEAPVRSSKGHCIKVEPGETGLLVAPIKRGLEYDGYKGSKEMTSKKVLENVFKNGDKYYNSGDLLYCDKEYFVYFSDRIGDTFRWKGENVSTTEVGNVLADISWIEDANSYGVHIPGYDGRAGMVALTLKDGMDITEKHLKEVFHKSQALLPNYAIPRFLRIQKNMNITGTFKQMKVELKEEAFYPDKCKGDPLFCVDLTNKTFIPLDSGTVSSIVKGSIRL